MASLKPDLLILDDFGLREFSLPQAEDLFELICDRYQVGPLIVASNRTPQDWYGLFPNPVLAEGALDRLVNSAHHVLMPGRSYRPLRRPDRQAAAPIPVEGIQADPPGPSHHKESGLCEQGPLRGVGVWHNWLSAAQPEKGEFLSPDLGELFGVPLREFHGV